ncbi:TPA: hypothetical protein I9Y63_003108 [Legionella pneumophila]|nr:hypothetical protein [Legionella pneumophila]HAT3984133.1 hypothetical protein [Legionella pneumophila]
MRDYWKVARPLPGIKVSVVGFLDEGLLELETNLESASIEFQWLDF